MCTNDDKRRSIKMENRDYISYEYQTKTVKLSDQSKAIDMYESFGWEVTQTNQTLGGVLISFKRDRKINHKQELVRLERKAEETMDSISHLEKSKKSGATIFSVLFGIISALILGGGMSLIMVEKPSWTFLVVGVVLGVVGILLCSITYFIYKKMVEKKTKQVLPIIDEQNEQLANILEQGNDLLKMEIV